MMSRTRTFSTGLLLAGCVGSATAAAPDNLPYVWSRMEAAIELPDVPPPPPASIRAMTPSPVMSEREVQPRLAAPCPDGQDQQWRSRASGPSRT